MTRRDPLDACIVYEHAARQVSDLSKRIGEALGRCGVSVRANEPDASGMFPQNLLDGAHVKTHLWQAYHETTDVDHYYREDRRLDKGEQEDFLLGADCPHCLEAWRLVQQRKVARQAFGAAKRAIRQIGRSAIARSSA